MAVPINAERNATCAAGLLGFGGIAIVGGISLSGYSMPLFIPAIVAHLALPALGVSASLTGTIVTLAAIIPSVMAIGGVAAVVLGGLSVSAGVLLGCMTCCMI